jgi:3-hydroxybutyryl-CoA dehydratase
MSYDVGDKLPPFVIESASPDVEVVKAKGLGDRVINQGPMNVAFMINMLMAAFPGATIEAMDSRFLDNVYGGDKVTAQGAITAVEGNRISCEFTLDVDGRGTVNSGTATLLV